MIEQFSIPVHEIKLSTNPFRILRLLHLYFLLRKIKPDIVQTWMYHADFLGGIIARIASCRKIIWNIRNTDFLTDAFASPWTWLMLKLSALFSRFLPSTIVVVANEAKSNHARLGYAEDKMFVIPNGFDANVFRPDDDARKSVRKELGLSNDRILIGSVGSYNFYKNQKLFVETALSLCADFPNLCFVMVGRGVDEENEELSALVQGSSFTNRFLMLGERMDVPRIFNCLDLFCLHSISEGFPNVLGEAMATGIPCVATDVGDAGYLLGDTGKLVPPNNQKLLAAALRSLIRLSCEERAQMGARSRQRIMNDFTLAMTNQRYLELYQQSGTTMSNIDKKVVDGFGSEWAEFDQSQLSPDEVNDLFQKYFSIFPWDRISGESVGFDLGCGSGRWAKLAASRVGHLHCIDPSAALGVAKSTLESLSNCSFHKAHAGNLPFEDATMDFGYSLGVLHHIPDPEEALTECVRKIKPKAPFLVYLYYAFDNKPWWFRMVWRCSNLMRLVISRLPRSLCFLVCNLIAIFVYWPLARFSLLLPKLGLSAQHFPLNFYSKLSLYTMRTDSLDRFGTRLEHRFTKSEIREMMERSGLVGIEFSDSTPYWCAIGFRAQN
jgi:glycosyltransferase involved in cell wall biosynthesis/SAM-dependent methyltransferase